MYVYVYICVCVYRENVDIQDACSITEEKNGIKACVRVNIRCPKGSCDVHAVPVGW